VSRHLCCTAGTCAARQCVQMDGPSICIRPCHSTPRHGPCRRVWMAQKGQGRCSRAGAALDRLDLSALAQLGVALAVSLLLLLLLLLQHSAWRCSPCSSNRAAQAQRLPTINHGALAVACSCGLWAHEAAELPPPLPGVRALSCLSACLLACARGAGMPSLYRTARGEGGLGAVWLRGVIFF